MLTPQQIAMYYHLHHTQASEDLPLWLDLAKDLDGPILELGCGSGRVLLALAEAGHRVVGIDHDPTMLAVLRDLLVEKPHLEVTVVEADFSMGLPEGKFPLIIMPCNTLSTLDASTRAATLAAVRRALEPGGLFVAALPNPELLNDLEDSSEPEFELAIELEDGQTLAVSSGWQRETNPEGDWLRFDWVYDVMNDQGQIERGVMSTRHDLSLSREELIREFQQAGLEVEVQMDADQAGMVILGRLA
jgi:SAM-dependent methyltransferase